MHQLKSFIDVAESSDFPIQNLPFGIFSPKGDKKPRVGVALGNSIIDLSVLEKSGLLQVQETNKSIFNRPALNDFVALGREVWLKTKKQLVSLYKENSEYLSDHYNVLHSSLYDRNESTMHVPFDIGDYTDFYSSESHATNIGVMFRDKKNALLPNWKHLPVGYHGRASSIITTDIPIHRPYGQVWSDENTVMVKPSEKLDFELEMAFFVGQSSKLGQPVPIQDAKGYIFGFVIMNDWSARDIQKWEYVPLGPFLSKSFATSVSPWVVTTDTLEPYRVKGPIQSPKVQNYLHHSEVLEKSHYDITLDVKLKSMKMEKGQLIAQSNFSYTYWSVYQQLAHHTVGGCNIDVGDLMASGTISGPEKQQFGSMLELAWNGTDPITLNSGEKRCFIEDYDTVTLHAYINTKHGYRIGFGELNNQVLPAKNL